MMVQKSRLCHVTVVVGGCSGGNGGGGLVVWLFVAALKVKVQGAVRKEGQCLQGKCPSLPPTSSLQP